MKYIKWLKTAAVFQFITAFVHTVTLFLKPPPNNETEKQIFDLMSTYEFDFGGGFFRSMSELTLALSSCFSLVCLLGGLLNWYLIKQNLSKETITGVININLLVFGICFTMMAVFTFLPPIILSGLVFFFLIVSRITISKET
ncbi:MAG: hypothetical protein L0Y35_07630 [Flammeovirgaceae bacterium]|nr:hypothetical protein [Flammeovirgaceae bacterium]